MTLKQFVCALIAASAVVAAAEAQELDVGVRSYGLRGGINFNPDQFNFGAHVDMGRFGSRVRLQPSAEVGFGNGVMLAATNFDAHYLFTARRWRPYAGGGLGINFIDVSRGFGSSQGLQIEPVVNVVGGVEWGAPKPGSRAFRRYLLEARLGMGKTPDFKIVAGLSF
jgi:hypothetical protein